MEEIKENDNFQNHEYEWRRSSVGNDKWSCHAVCETDGLSYTDAEHDGGFKCESNWCDDGDEHAFKREDTEDESPDEPSGSWIGEN